MTHESIGSREFDQYAQDYDQVLTKGLAVSGEGRDYFAQGRIDWLKARMEDAQFFPRRIIDYGCGSGGTATLLLRRFDAESVVGIDSSKRLIELAEREYGSPFTTFRQIEHYHPHEKADLVYCNGVFHHVPMAEREMVMQYVWTSLEPGGYFALWENNPWNPGTLYVMSRIPFDRDAVTLAAPEACRLLRINGFQIVRTDYLFIFPRCLRALRWMEPRLSKLPFGAQYLVLARKIGIPTGHA